MEIDRNEYIIELKGADNVRDLGGHPIISGGNTKKKVFFRSDSLHNLSKEDLKILKDKGVTMQIDLRSPYEVNIKPSIFFESKEIIYRNISLFDRIQSSDFMSIPKSMAELYRDLLDNNQEQFAIIFRTLLENKGASIFSCTAGKDRTGIVAMLLLSLVQVEEESILDDYSISESNLSDLIRIQKKKMANQKKELPDYIFSSDAENMRKTILYLKEKYINAEEYLFNCGMLEEEINELKTRLHE